MKLIHVNRPALPKDMPACWQEEFIFILAPIVTPTLAGKLSGLIALLHRTSDKDQPR